MATVCSLRSSTMTTPLSLRRLPLVRSGVVLSLLVMLAGFAATLVAYELVGRIRVAEVRGRFTADAADTTASVEERLRVHGEVLLSLQGLYASVGDAVTRDQFRRYVDQLDLTRRYPGFQALQAIRYLRPEELSDFVARIRADTSVDPKGYPDFAVRPAGERPAYYVIHYVEPMRGNESAFGFDGGSNPTQTRSLERSRDTGRIVATPPIRLVQDATGQAGFVLRAPIYRNGMPIEDEAQRRAALTGFVAAVYRMNDLMHGIVDARTLQQTHIRIYDIGPAKAAGGAGDEPRAIMYDSL